jgi:hypothetical protein
MAQQTEASIELSVDIEGNGVNGVHIKVDKSSMPYQVATFDGSEQVSKWKAAMQQQSEIWFADGYLKCKARGLYQQVKA